MRRTWGLRVLATILLAVGAYGITACAASDDADESTPATSPPAEVTVCIKAGQLLESGDADGAIKIIGDYRQPALDRLAAGAAQITDEQTSAACDEVFKRALIAQHKAATTTAVQDAGQTWAGFTKAWTEPLVAMVTWALGAAAVLIVLARLAVPLWMWSRQRSYSSMPLTRFGGWSAVAVVVGSLAAVGIVAFFPDLKRSLGVAFALLTIACAAAFSWWLGARPRVAVRVSGADGTASVMKSQRLTKIVIDLGAAPPRGIESPDASDISQITAATSKVTSNAFVTLVVSLIEYIANTAPWQVDVQELSDRRALVRMRRNGSEVRSEVVDADALHLPAADDTPDAVIRMAAAVVATGMAERYPDWTGLYGTDSWKSVGLHDVARTLPAASKASKEDLLRGALLEDQGNELALTSLENHLHRESTTEAELKLYGETLERQAVRLAALAGTAVPFILTPREGDRPTPVLAGSPPAPPHQLVRTLVLWASVQRNRFAVSGNALPVIDPAVHAAAFTVLVTAIGTLHGDDDRTGDDLRADPEFIERVRARTAFSLRRLFATGRYGTSLHTLISDTATWCAAATVAEDSRIAYAYACNLAMAEPWTGNNAAVLNRQRSALITRKLTLALNDPKLPAWARRDPELAPIRDSHWGVLHRDLPDSTMDVEPLADHKSALSELGIEDPAGIVAAPDGLAKFLGLKPIAYRHLVEVAGLAALLEAHTPEVPSTDAVPAGTPWSADADVWDKRVPLILQKLLTGGVDSVALLRSATGADLQKTLGDALRGINGSADSFLTPQQALARLRKAWKPAEPEPKKGSKHNR